ncbi:MULTISPECIES: guanylate kinase [Rickettsieae]|uniref:guanylate kinase n=1 Tax=Rickettsieae TaxID=33988 RepID=UPI000B9B5D2D|nr:guanylate kinase [Rickettsia endosymbiont of Culicoides newsteadi]OZG32339.1 guanylate kinase [Rickettsia endosymbiont of Culicoides newsteadi]
MVLSLKSKGLTVILSSPSAAGKSSLARAALKIDSNLRLSISATTRTPRTGEIDGVSYYFKTKEEFNKLIEQDEFLEYANIYNNYYGTPKKVVEELLSQGLDVLFDIDWQGTKSIKKILSNVITIFVLPPTPSVLQQRIQNRGQDSKEAIELRMKLATKEVQYAKYYDYVVINDDFEITLKTIYSIIIAERVKRIRLNLDKFYSNWQHALL